MTAQGTVLENVKRRSAWNIFMGLLMVVLGALLIIYPFATATLTVLFLGVVLLLVGVAELVLAFASQTPSSFFLRLLLAAIYGFTGLVLLAFPFQGVEALTLFAGAMLLLRGVLAAVAAFRVRPLPGWGWLLADGSVSALVGVLILAKWPSSSFWAVGTLIGAAVLVTGLARTTMAARIRTGAGDVERLARPVT
jgi:uncharacterized membrane protein HdeD (DUF308 family)